MANKCENTLTLSTQERENYLYLRDEIMQSYECDLKWETSAFGCYSLRMTFFSAWTFPLHAFLKLTARRLDTNLQINVISREESMDYVGHYRFKHGIWQMQSPDWQDASPQTATGHIVTVTFSRQYKYTEQEMTRRLGRLPIDYESLRIADAKRLAWEDLRENYLQGKIAPQRECFVLSTAIHTPE